MNKLPAPLSLTAVLLTQSASPGQIAVNAPTSPQWSQISYGSSIPDPYQDEQATAEDSDIIGNAANAAFYKAFWDGGTPGAGTDGEMGFRVRMAGDKTPAGFNHQMFVGFDLNANGSMDLFLGANSAELTLRAPGSGANTSPSTTTISNSPFYTAAATPLTYDWSPVTAALDPAATGFNLDGQTGGSSNHTDHFLSFKLSFAEFVRAAGLAGYSINDATPLSMVFATATQSNSLNQDLGGVSGGVSSALTWSALGALSRSYSAASAAPVPEPEALSLSALSCAVLLMRRRR